MTTTIKHPYYEMDSAKALELARRLKNGPLPSPNDVEPTLEEAIALIHEERRTCGFNWITGRVAEQVLRVLNGENPATTFTT